jgi:exoribonuclease-2
MASNHDNHDNSQDRAILQDIARKAMLERGLLADVPADAQAELDRIQVPKTISDPHVRDLRQLLWSSIDNDDSRDLDQLAVAEGLADGNTRILVAIADVDSLVPKGSALDNYAEHNTTSVYTPAKIFSMLPEKLSTNLTSLNFNEDRLAVIIDMVIGADGALLSSDVYRAGVRNQAKLAYNRTAAWLNGNSDVPEAAAAVKGLAENLRLQDKTAKQMQQFRQTQGALSLETVEAKPVFDGNQIRELQVERKNRAKEMIENFMIAANGVTARYLAAKKFPSIRRVVRTPNRWGRIVELAAEHGFTLPAEPDSKALEQFLTQQKAKDAQSFPDVSLAVIKLLGAGEYVAELPDAVTEGHFGLAVKDYGHSTAPNRRYVDLLTQRLLKAAVEGRAVPYSLGDLAALAAHCTQEEDAANKVERQVSKSAAALLLQAKIGEQFDGLVTGASPKGTWVRLLTLPVEGRLIHGFEGMDVGDKLRVQLASVDIEKGYIDFRKV